MKVINVKDYTVRAKQQDGKMVDVPYKVKDSLADILFNPELKLAAVGLLKQNKLAEKILDTKTDELRLEDEEYERVKTAVETLRGLQRNDVELVRRVLEAADVSN